MFPWFAMKPNSSKELWISGSLKCRKLNITSGKLRGWMADVEPD